MPQGRPAVTSGDDDGCHSLPQRHCPMVVLCRTPALASPGPPAEAVILGVVHPAPAQPVCRKGSVRARRELRINPLDEPMEVRARPSRHANFLPRACIASSCVASSCWRSRAARAPAARNLQTASRSWPPPTRRWPGAASGPAGRCAAAAGARTRAPPASILCYPVCCSHALWPVP